MPDNQKLALELFQKTGAKNQSENLFFSPLSVETALAMTWEGSRGDTESEIGHLLGETSPSALRDRLHGLLEALTTGEHPYRLVMANSFWAQSGVTFLPSFTKILGDDYDAESKVVDFGAPEASKQINDWVKSQTDGKIAELVGPGTLTAATRLVLANAVYFKAPWQRPFSSGLTANSSFYADGTREVQVPMMRQTKEIFSYFEDKDLQAVSLPYKGGRLSMLVLLPRGRNGLPAMAKSLNPDRLQTVTNGLRPRQVNLSMPRFRFSFRRSLAQPLRELGMKSPFEPSADFSGMCKDCGLRLSDVLHQAFVDVNEDGTEAAAATASLMFGATLMGPPPAVFIADHPFLFFVLDRPSGSILFMGRMSDPSVATGGAAR